MTGRLYCLGMDWLRESTLLYYHHCTYVYHDGVGYSFSSTYLPNSRFLYATGSCNVCVLISLQNRSNPTFNAVALAPVTSNTPDVTRSPTSVVTTLTLATHSATSPRSSADSAGRLPLYFWYSAESCSPARSARASVARRCAKKLPYRSRM